MSLATAPYSVDQDARALRERLELAVLSSDDRACAEAARALVAFCDQHAEYMLCALIPESSAPKPEPAVRIASKFSGRCKACSAFITPGDEVFFTPGEKGVICLKCGGTQR